jgi:uncharacterized protein
MKIQITGLSEGVHEFRFSQTASALDLGERFHGDVAVEARLEKTGTQLSLRAAVSVEAMFICDRCTAEFRTKLTPSYRMYYVWDETEAGQIDPAEVHLLPQGESILDLSDDVRQTILLAVPLKLLCREECRGLCPHCGTDLNVGTCSCFPVTEDSRWDTLRQLRQGSN